MTPKEKAEELFDLFDKIPRYAKRAVDEIINSVDNEHVSGIYDDFWQEVKQELEKL